MILVQESQTLSQGSNEQVPSGKGRTVEVVAVAKRRQFSTTYKRQMVRKAAACEAVGGIGELLRQEGLYSSHLAKWRRELGSDEHAALAPKRRGPKVDVAKAEARRVAVLEREVSRLRLKLTHAEHIIAAQKNCASCWACRRARKRCDDGQHRPGAAGRDCRRVCDAGCGAGDVLSCAATCAMPVGPPGTNTFAMGLEWCRAAGGLGRAA